MCKYVASKEAIGSSCNLDAICVYGSLKPCWWVRLPREMGTGKRVLGSRPEDSTFIMWGGRGEHPLNKTKQEQPEE